ncbi:hypothetical protein BDZ91DRAFT_781777 [Kalaharituber pfeilii]|nr:hypothetical protein BDZ91DRAFT_781777 [Kalaharituber pfeilii]
MQSGNTGLGACSKLFGKLYEWMMVDNVKHAICQLDWARAPSSGLQLSITGSHPKAWELGIRMVESLTFEASEPELAERLTVQSRVGRGKRMKQFDETNYNMKWELHWGVWAAGLASTKPDPETAVEEDTPYLSPLPGNFQSVKPQLTVLITESTPPLKLVFENQELSYFHCMYYQHVSPISWGHQQMLRLLPVQWMGIMRILQHVISGGQCLIYITSLS